MSNVLVLTESRQLFESLERLLRRSRGIRTRWICLPPLSPKGHPHIHPDDDPRGPGWVVNTFRTVADSMEETIGHGDGRLLGNTVCIADLFDPNWSPNGQLAPTAGSLRWAAAASMLVLAFPEVLWIFFSSHPPGDLFPEPKDDGMRKRHDWNIPEIRESHVWDCGAPRQSLAPLLQKIDRHTSGRRNLFDPSGLRDYIRHAIKITIPEQASAIPLRTELAAAIDDEPAYTYLAAYVTYRHGYRTHMVASHSHMKDLFGGAAQGRRPEVTMEDLYLSFPDSDPDFPEGCSVLKDRDRRDRYPGLRDATCRVFLTGGHTRTLDRAGWRENREYLRQWREDGIALRRSHLVFKPIGGISNLVRDARIANAPEFSWPPGKPTGVSGSHGHSSPGRLLLIGDYLIRRAERLSSVASSAEDCILGALLALEAQELLGNRTPTTALSALSLRMRFEVLATCRFSGLQAHLATKLILAEIRAEVQSIGNWFHSRSRTIAELNAQARIINDLVAVLRDANLFDEEHALLERARAVEREWWLRVTPWAFAAYPFRTYTEYLLGGIHRIVGAMLAWIVVLSALHYTFDPCTQHRVADSFARTLSMFTTTGFFAQAQPADTIAVISLELPATRLSVQPSLLLGVLTLAIGVGHVGVLLSSMYVKFSRR